jgi:hypothetical protein
MAWKMPRDRKLVVVLFVAGAVLPVVFLVL